MHRKSGLTRPLRIPGARSTGPGDNTPSSRVASMTRRWREKGMAARIGKDLTGKVAVITGASSGIGAASARLFAEAGARVVVGYNQGVDRANAVVESLAGGGPTSIRLPLEDSAEIGKAAAAVREEFGRADILVNSAGFTRMVAHHDLEALT